MRASSADRCDCGCCRLKGDAGRWRQVNKLNAASSEKRDGTPECRFCGHLHGATVLIGAVLYLLG